jgi:LuxR family maltose regulon positive regulatory protein
MNPLLKTKLRPPPLPARWIERTRLVQRMTASMEAGARVTLVSAPAGYGKTTLLSSWSNKLDMPTAWINLDAQDNEGDQFFQYLWAALAHETLGINVDKNTLVVANEENAKLLIHLIKLIEDYHQPLLIVLDDYHTVFSAAIHSAIRYLLDHQPANLHVAIGTRADPPLPIARYRARGQLTELRAEDLNFDHDETFSFLEAELPWRLDEQDLKALEEKIEGWIAGLKLAVLSLQSRSEPQALIRQLSGTQRFILDFLVEEVLEHQPEDVRDFLMRSSILEPLSVSLCDAALGYTRSDKMLETLLRNNMFVLPHDEERNTFRYHPLFADLLSKELARHMSGTEIREIHARASKWCSEHGQLRKAIEHALAANEFAVAASWIEESISSSQLDSRLTVILPWIDALPLEALESRPRLSIYSAFALFMDGQVERFRETMGIAEAATQAAEHVEPREKDELERLLQIIGGLTKGLWLGLGGDPEASMHAVEPVKVLARDLGMVVFEALALEGLSLARTLQGKLREAAALCQEIVELGLQHSIDRKSEQPLAAMGYVEWARILIEWNDLAQAGEHLERAIHLAMVSGGARILVEAHLVTAEMRLAQGDIEAARHELTQAENAYTLRAPTSVTGQRLARTWMRLDLQRGELVSMQRRMAALEAAIDRLPPDRALPATQYESLQMLKARACIHEARPDEALAILSPLLHPAEELGRWGRVAEIAWLQAIAFASANDRIEAMRSLEVALQHSKPGGFRRLFINEGQRGGSLLADYSEFPTSSDESKQYAQELLSLLRKEQASKFQPPAQAIPQASALIEDLTRRETEVLKWICAGLTNQEIAETLVISVNTVKRHIANLYGKLEAANRAQAIARARQLGIVDE